MIEWLKSISVGSVLAIIVTVGGFILIGFKPDVKTETIALMTLVLSFYFGSSKGSQDKNDTISKLTAGGPVG